MKPGSVNTFQAEAMAREQAKAEAPLVSIVIATYKQHTSLPIAVRSALNQTYPNIEVIVVPVESDVETLHAIDVLAAHHEIRWVNSTRANYVYQRALGVLNSRGKWFSWFDSDDYMLPAKVRGDLMIAFAEKAYVVYSPLIAADQYFRPAEMIKTEPFSYNALTKNCFITDSSLTLRSMFLEFGLDESKGEMAFYNFWLHIAEKYPERIRLNPFPGVVYCQHDTQMHRKWSAQERAAQRKAVVDESLARMRRRRAIDEE
jgi:glycosyltransferase involved in cell wall biosynthesis